MSEGREWWKFFRIVVDVVNERKTSAIVSRKREKTEQKQNNIQEKRALLTRISFLRINFLSLVHRQRPRRMSKNNISAYKAARLPTIFRTIWSHIASSHIVFVHFSFAIVLAVAAVLAPSISATPYDGWHRCMCITDRQCDSCPQPAW